MYAGTAPERVEETLELVNAELDRLVADGGVTEKELNSAKGHLTGSLALSLESSSSRMHRIGRSELTMGEIPSLDDVVAAVEAVTPDDVAGDRPGAGIERAHARRGRPRRFAVPVDAVPLVRSHSLSLVHTAHSLVFRP